MNTKFPKAIIATVLLFTLAACNLTAPATEPPVTQPPSVPTATLPAETPTATATEAVSQVVVSVVRESLNIRRGPSVNYDTLGAFVSGQSAVANGRTTDGSWVSIPLPNNPSVNGWVSLLTQYTSVEGVVESLPLVSVPPAVPAVIRNCTYHPMLIQPNGTLIKEQTYSDNKANFPPGTYSAYDQSQEGHPMVATWTLTEGDQVDINTDGLGNTYYCP